MSARTVSMLSDFRTDVDFIVPIYRESLSLVCQHFWYEMLLGNPLQIDAYELYRRLDL
jgi:hypothetical protein